MRVLLLSTILSVLTACEHQSDRVKDFPKHVGMFSPKSNISLELNNGKFELDKNEFVSDLIFPTEITNGTYVIENDILTLKGQNGKTYSLRIETGEILQPIDFDTLKQSHKFLAWNTFHPNRLTKKSGGWTSDNEKSGVWTTYNEHGEVTNMKLYEKGKLINANFKYETTNQ